MAQTTRATSRQRVQVKVIDVETGEERFSSETVIVGGHCSFCCSCSNTIPVVNFQQAEQTRT